MSNLRVKKFLAIVLTMTTVMTAFSMPAIADEIDGEELIQAEEIVALDESEEVVELDEVLGNEEEEIIKTEADDPEENAEIEEANLEEVGAAKTAHLSYDFGDMGDYDVNILLRGRLLFEPLDGANLDKLVSGNRIKITPKPSSGNKFKKIIFGESRIEYLPGDLVNGSVIHTITDSDMYYNSYNGYGVSCSGEWAVDSSAETYNIYINSRSEILSKYKLFYENGDEINLGSVTELYGSDEPWEEIPYELHWFEDFYKVTIQKGKKVFFKMKHKPYNNEYIDCFGYSSNGLLSLGAVSGDGYVESELITVDKPLYFGVGREADYDYLSANQLFYIEKFNGGSMVREKEEGYFYYKNGRIKDDNALIEPGEELKLEIIPDDGYELDRIGYYYSINTDIAMRKINSVNGKLYAPTDLSDIDDYILYIDATFKKSDVKREALIQAVKTQTEERTKVTENKGGTKEAPVVVEVKQAVNDTIVLKESYVKGKAKARTISANGMEGNSITINAGAKFVVEGSDFEIKNDEANAAKISKKGVLSAKAVKGKTKYGFRVEFKNKDGNPAAIDVTVNNITVDKAVKNTVLYSVAGEVKDANDAVIKKVPENLSTEVYEVKLNDSEMASGVWTLNAGKGAKACATMSVAEDGNTVFIKPVAGKKGTAKITCDINGKKYNTSVKILDSTEKKLSSKQKTPVSGNSVAK